MYSHKITHNNNALITKGHDYVKKISTYYKDRLTYSNVHIHVNRTMVTCTESKSQDLSE